MPLYAGAVPYGPDVKKLEERFPIETLYEGMLIEHFVLESVINQKRGTSRYYGTINSWKMRILNRTNVFLAWLPGQGLEVLDPAKVFGHVETKTRQKMRQTGRAVRMYGHVNRDRLNDIGQRRLDHQMKVLDAMRQHLDAAKREMAIELVPVRSLPKPEPVG